MQNTITIKINENVNEKIQVFNAKIEVCNYLIEKGVDNENVYNLKNELGNTLNNIVDTIINSNDHNVIIGEYDWFVDFTKRTLEFTPIEK